MAATEFIIGPESIEAISEALKIFLYRNPSWKPTYFITDYLDAKIGSSEEVFSRYFSVYLQFLS